MIWGDFVMDKRQYLIKPVIDHDYPMAVRAKGIYIYDREGRKYIDGASGAVTVSIGHGVPEVIQAMQAQAEHVSFIYRSQFTTQPSEDLAKKISEWTPGDLNWSFFVNSGSEATETAMKIAIQYWQEKGIETKTKIISRWIGYHGITMGALSMSGNVGRRQRFASLLEDYPRVSAPYCYRCPFHQTPSDCGLLCADELEREIKRAGAERIAAFIAEPIIGASGGAITPPDGYYQKIKGICERYDVLFIADEVMTGIGRTGKRFGMDHWKVVPDIVTIGKGLSAGYAPIAATVVSDHVMEPIESGSKSVMSGHTYSANPQSTATALAVMAYMDRHRLVERADQNGAYLKEQLEEVRKNCRIIGDIRGKGMLIGIEFVADKRSKKPFPEEVRISEKVIHHAMSEGLIIYAANAGEEGLYGNAVIVSPPLTITKKEIDQLVAIFSRVIHLVETDLLKRGVLLNTD